MSHANIIPNKYRSLQEEKGTYVAISVLQDDINSNGEIQYSETSEEGEMRFRAWINGVSVIVGDDAGGSLIGYGSSRSKALDSLLGKLLDPGQAIPEWREYDLSQTRLKVKRPATLCQSEFVGLVRVLKA
jgi:hypothetical protein